MSPVLVTGCAGFIGFHLCELLLKRGVTVYGCDALTDYYDVELKKSRLALLEQHQTFDFACIDIENSFELGSYMASSAPTSVVHLAAQAGVRYSVENPRAYVDTNVIGTFNVLEAASKIGVKHLLAASTSSVYGANEEQPFVEVQKADSQLTIYAATKKATESIGHAWAHIHELPVTMFRFFTVYGPWGRPDMALFKFTKGIIEGEPIDIYNQGEMYRDFTYVDDLVASIASLIEMPPLAGGTQVSIGDSHVAPFRIINIGNASKVRLLDFVTEIENALGIKANKNFLPMQLGDVPSTFANVDSLHKLTGSRPNTPYALGIKNFVNWYREFYGVN